MTVGKRVVVLDYGSGNLRSAQRALERVGAQVTVTDDLDLAARADGLVVPGVGAYAACMQGIDQLGAGPVIAERVRRRAPVLGICVGMQVLFAEGDEHGTVTKGLGVLPGAVTRLEAQVVPHMGWNTVVWPTGSVLGAGIAPDARFYFVHSYAARPVQPAGWEVSESETSVSAVARSWVRFGVSEHGGPFAAAVESGVVSATQFHPEKSGDAGASLLTNWIGVL